MSEFSGGSYLSFGFAGRVIGTGGIVVAAVFVFVRSGGTILHNAERTEGVRVLGNFYFSSERLEVVSA